MGRRPRFTTPLTRLRDTLVKNVIRPLDVFSPEVRLLIGFSLLIVTTSLLLFTNYSSAFYANYKDGEVVKATVVSPSDVTTIDIAETERRRDAAREATRPVFFLDSTRGESSAQSFQAAWDELRMDAERNQRKPGEWNGEGGAAVARVIIAHRFDPEALDRLTALIREIGEGYIYDDSDARHMKQEIVLVDYRNPTAQMIMPAPQTRMTTLNAARRNLELRIRNLGGWSADEKTALYSAIAPLIKPNVVLDQTATAAAREADASKVVPVRISLKKNQVIAREGDTVTPAMRAQFDAIQNSGHAGRPWQRLLGLFLLVTALYWAAWKFTEHRSTSTTLTLSKERTFALIGSAILVQTVLLRVGFYVGSSVAAQKLNAPFNDPTIWNFAIPFAAAALLVAMLVDTQLAFMTGIVTALFAGLLAQSGMQKSVYATVACAVAIYGIGRYRERQSVTIAGLLVGAANAVMALALIAYAEQQLTINTILLALACGFAGGLLTAIFTAGGLPINESLFGILTDVKLLELSNADLPVLGQMALRAPGTNQHSHAVGQLAEEACRAINANPLLARIGALYHDIGKLAAPDYFVENQQGSNPHDHLRPLQSAKIIISHVTYGMKLGRELGLPKKIRDFIPQHHGTRTLHFFLRKAEDEAKPEETVDAEEFRYPGPKPQSQEAAIMMLADSCEAAARSLARPDPDNIRAIVVKIVDAIVSDGQLDECDISLRELTTIRETMIHSLTAIYHARVDYPGFNPPRLTGPLAPLPQGDLDSEERGVLYKRASEVPISKGGEVEDEAVPQRVAKR
ncbi:MAG: putative metal-dependent phosphohydrolase [Acidobacteria bacterium]|nr:putative metal-dependent phosphohydrolase [Acidobacteriota bacterium]